MQALFPAPMRTGFALPGIGPYTAAAIASIGLGEPVAAVDGNVQRVAARWNAMPLPVDAPQGAKAIQAIADAWLHHDHPGDHNQAVMEVGALVCSPKRPQCDACPLSPTCQSAHNEDLWSQLPVKKPKKKATAWDLTWHVVTHKGSVVAMKRPSEGVWANLWAFPELSPRHPLPMWGRCWNRSPTSSPTSASRAPFFIGKPRAWMPFTRLRKRTAGRR